MSSKEDYSIYYDLSDYLFHNVHKKYQENGYLEGFDFYLILIWKANRAKFRNAKKVFNKSKNKTFDEGVEILTKQIFNARSDFERVQILFNWKFRVATASAISSVLYPNKYTIYDYRVLESEDLLEFKNLDNKLNVEEKVNGYLEFVESFKNLRIKLGFKSLRELDKYLWGQSLFNQVKKEIKKLDELSR